MYDVALGTYLLGNYNDITSFLVIYSFPVKLPVFYYTFLTVFHAMNSKVSMPAGTYVIFNAVCAVFITAIMLLEFSNANKSLNKNILSYETIPDMIMIIAYGVYIFISHIFIHQKFSGIFYLFSRFVLGVYIFLLHAEFIENIYLQAFSRGDRSDQRI